MSAKLRTWMGSWRVWVIIGCLAYIGLVHWQGSRIAAAWPGGVWVAVGLLFLALLVVVWIVNDVLTRYVFVPFFTRLQGKKTNDLTAKAREKFADSLMSISTAIASAVFISVLVFPLTVFIQTMALGKDPLWAWLPGLLSRGTKPEWWPLLFAAMFLGLYLLPLVIAHRMREGALKIYDTLPPSALAVASTAQGTNEQPRIPAEGQTTHTSANGGSRRRRRPRAK
jgi:hypothetical protein